MNSTMEKLSPWLFTIGLFVLWELACRIFNVDTFVLPAPSQIFVADRRSIGGRSLQELVRHAVDHAWRALRSRSRSASCSA